MSASPASAPVPAAHPARRCGAALLLAFTLLTGALAARLATRDSRAAAVDPRWRINPNRASAAELELLPGVGPALAANIIAFRESAGSRPAFAQPHDLDAVARIGPATIERLTPLLTFDEPAEPHRRP